MSLSDVRKAYLYQPPLRGSLVLLTAIHAKNGEARPRGHQTGYSVCDPAREGSGETTLSRVWHRGLLSVSCADRRRIRRAPLLGERGVHDSRLLLAHSPPNYSRRESPRWPKTG